MASRFTKSSGREILAASHRQLNGYLVDVNGRTLRTVSTPDHEGGKSDRVSAGEWQEENMCMVDDRRERERCEWVVGVAW